MWFVNKPKLHNFPMITPTILARTAPYHDCGLVDYINIRRALSQIYIARISVILLLCVDIHYRRLVLIGEVRTEDKNLIKMAEG